MGAKNFDLAERYAYEAAKIGFLLFAVVGVFAALAPELILRAFCKDEAVIALALPLLRLLSVMPPIICVGLVFTYALYGAGNSIFVMAVEGVLHVFCLVPLAGFLGIVLGLGIWGVWSAMIVYVTLLTAIMAWKFGSGSWKAIQI